MILTQSQSAEIEFLVGSPDLVEALRNTPPAEVFSPELVDFLSNLSTVLIKNTETKSYPDLITFAFFCRKANLAKLKNNYGNSMPTLGRGVVFHVTPSNIPVNFAYSLVAGLLAGNCNIVRLPSKDFPQVEIICNAINTILTYPSFKKIIKRIILLKYERNSEINASFSSICDVRVIWGGDTTIGQIREAPIPARAFDVTFPDRFSMAIINADSIVGEADLIPLTRGFYNDTYLFDQNACTAPRLVVWTGEATNIEVAKNRFWTCLLEQLMTYNVSGIAAIDKLSTLLLHANDCTMPHQAYTGTNKLWRVELEQLSLDIDNHRCSSGYFLEYTAKSLSELCHIVNKKYQTLAYFGYSKNELLELIKNNPMNGVDRVVPIGLTTEFSMVWDGFDLIRTLSRECTLL